MVRVLILALAASALQAQTAAAPPAGPTPPAKVDRALRARISQFYQYEVAGKFHEAEQLVAAETKDLFVGSSKPSFYAYQIVSIKYAPDFKTAEAVVLVSRHMPVEGFIGHPLNSKIGSRWKLEHGKWCYYVDPSKDLPASPFGGVAPPAMGMPRPAISGTIPGSQQPPAPAPPPVQTSVTQSSAAPTITVPQAVPLAVAPGARPLPAMGAVPAVPTVLTVNKLAVSFKAAESGSDQIVITNPTPFAEPLVLTQPNIAGLSAKLDHNGVAAGDKATLTIEWKGSPQAPPRVNIFVKAPQTNQVIPVTITFAK